MRIVDSSLTSSRSTVGRARARLVGQTAPPCAGRASSPPRRSRGHRARRLPHDRSTSGTRHQRNSGSIHDAPLWTIRGPLLPSGRLDLHFTPTQEPFPADARAWLADRLDVRSRRCRTRRSGRRARVLRPTLGVGAGARPRQLDRAGLAGRARWTGATLVEQMIFYEEYARAADQGASASSARACSGRRSSISDPRNNGPHSCPASCAAPRSGARATRSLTRAPTSPT